MVLREILDGTDCSWPSPAPRLVTLQEVGELQGKRHALFEWVPGVTLRETLAALELVGRPAPIGLVGRVLLDAARALAAATPARPHGGLSAGALQIGFDGVVSVLDWGAPRLSRFRPLGRVNFAYDVFTLGAVLHSALTGYVGEYASLPPTLPPPSTSHAEASPAVDDVVMRALSAQPDGRQANLDAFADELEAVLGDEAYTTAQLAEVVRALFKERIKLLQSLGGLVAGPDPLEAELPEATRPPVPAFVPLGASIPPGTQPGRGGPPASLDLPSSERTETRVPVPGEGPAPRAIKPWDSSYDLEPAGPADEGTLPGVFAPADRMSAPVRASAREEATNPGAPPPGRRGGDTGPEPALQLAAADPVVPFVADDAARSGGPRPEGAVAAPRASASRAAAGRPSFDDETAPRASGPRPSSEGLAPRATGPRPLVDDAAPPRASSDAVPAARASGPRPAADDAVPPARASGPRPSGDEAIAPRASNEALPSARASGPRPAPDGGFAPRASNPRAGLGADAPAPRATGARPAVEEPVLAALGEPTHPRARMPAPPPGRDGAASGFEDTQPRARASVANEDTAPRARVRGPERLPTPPRGIEVLGEDYADLNEPTAVRARLDAGVANAQTAQKLPVVRDEAPEAPAGGGGALRVIMVALLLVVVGLAGAALYKLRNGTLGPPVTAPAPEPEPTALADVELDAGTTPDGDAGEPLDAGAEDAGAALDAGLEADAGVSPDAGTALDAGVADAGVPEKKPVKKPAKKPVKKKRR